MKKEEKLLRAIGGVDDDLIADAMEPQKRKKQPAWLRWTAVAACLCLLLASPAGANMIGGIVEEFRSVRAPERYPATAFPQVALDAAKGQDGSVFHPTASMEEAMAFAGLKHLENPVLAEASPKEVHTTTINGEEYDTAFQTWLKVVDGEIWIAIVEGWYTIDLSSVSVNYILNSDQTPTDSGFAFDPAEMGHREDYTTPDGMSCVLYTHDGDQNTGFAECVGFAARGDCLIYVTVDNPVEKTAMTTLKQILDAYG